jgi:hypothetical protein
MKKKNKDLLDMTADEVIADIFHPKVAKHLRKHVKEHTKKIEEKEKRVKK